MGDRYRILDPLAKARVVTPNFSSLRGWSHNFSSLRRWSHNFSSLRGWSHNFSSLKGWFLVSILEHNTTKL